MRLGELEDEECSGGGGPFDPFAGNEMLTMEEAAEIPLQQRFAARQRLGGLWTSRPTGQRQQQAFARYYTVSRRLLGIFYPRQHAALDARPTRRSTDATRCHLEKRTSPIGATVS